ncbi:MAG: hypothetical protein AAGI11_13425 [Pseudomonadota bacterium]
MNRLTSSPHVIRNLDGTIPAKIAIGLALVVSLLSGCTHPVEVVGEGDVLSSSGERDCSAQERNCPFLVVEAFEERYTALPRAGHTFVRWQNCGDGALANQCHLGPVDADTVRQFWGVTLPPTTAYFQPINTVPLRSTPPIRVEQSPSRFNCTGSERQWLQSAPSSRFALVVLPCSREGGIRIVERLPSKVWQLYREYTWQELSDSIAFGHSPAFSGDGRYFFIMGQSTDSPLQQSLFSFAWDESQGSLSLLQSFSLKTEEWSFNVSTGLVHPATGNHVYVHGTVDFPGEFQDVYGGPALLSLSYDGEGRFTLLQLLSGDELGEFINPLVEGRPIVDDIESIQFNPSGSLLYLGVSSYPLEQPKEYVFSLFARSPSGVLAKQSQFSPSDFGIDIGMPFLPTFSPDGRRVYAFREVAVPLPKYLWVLDVMADGTFRQREQYSADLRGTRLSSLVPIDVSSDDQQLYIYDSFRDEVGIFSRQLRTDFMEQVSTFKPSGYQPEGWPALALLTDSGWLNSTSSAYLMDYEPAYQYQLFLGTLDLDTDVQLSLRGPRKVADGSPGQLNLAVYNSGPAPAYGVRLRVDFRGTQNFFIARNNSDIECITTPSAMLCDLPELSVAGLAELDIEVQSLGSTTITASASATTSQADLNTANNSESLTVRFVQDESEG